MMEMNSTSLRRVKNGYTTGARTLASRSVTRLARTRVTPNVLTAAGVSLCLAAAVLVPFENRANTWLVYWLAAGLFVVGSLLDILDGALARGTRGPQHRRARLRAMGRLAMGDRRACRDGLAHRLPAHPVRP